ncbi:hypothetical protein TRAPUB_5110 [Trametes pubescens]|uniref:Uncharacterized protein n=1 Tax=Trametes pubescens TaxID=154538 RepID=A0A1M2V9I8_TRAPU|nr:hypothetical protein TRAPUB_5110 [Trametes pubescens]
MRLLTNHERLLPRRGLHGSKPFYKDPDMYGQVNAAPTIATRPPPIPSSYPAPSVPLASAASRIYNRDAWHTDLQVVRRLRGSAKTSVKELASLGGCLGKARPRVQARKLSLKCRGARRKRTLG